MSFWDKPAEFYMAVMAGAGFLIRRHAEKPWIDRVVIIGSSGAAAVSLSSAASAEFGYPEVMWGFGITVVSFVVVDLTLSLISNKEAVMEIIKGKLGVKK